MLRALVLLVLILALIGCGPPTSHTNAAPTEIRFVLLPSDDGRGQTSTYEALRGGLERNLGMPVKFVKASDYSTVIEALKTRKAEIALLGPLSYVIAKREANAQAFVAGVGADNSGIYHSIITVRSDSPYHSLKDLKGKIIGLVDPASTSGSLMPHYMVLNEMGMPLEKYFSKVVYCGTHPTALKTLESGTVDVAAVEELLQGIMEKKGLLKKGSLREIERSQDLPPSPIVYRSDMDSALKKRIEKAFLTLPKLPAMSGFEGVDHFRVCEDREFNVVEQLYDKLKVDRDKALGK